MEHWRCTMKICEKYESTRALVEAYNNYVVWQSLPQYLTRLYDETGKYYEDDEAKMAVIISQELLRRGVPNFCEIQNGDHICIDDGVFTIVNTNKNYAQILDEYYSAEVKLETLQKCFKL